MQTGGAGDGAHRCRAYAPIVDRLFGGLFHLGMIGQAQIVVGAKIKHFFAVHHHPAIRRRIHDANVDEQMLGPKPRQFFIDEIKFVRHGYDLRKKE